MLRKGKQFRFLWVRVVRFVVFCAMLIVCYFVLFILLVVLSIRLRFTGFEYTFGIFNTVGLNDQSFICIS